MKTAIPRERWARLAICAMSSDACEIKMKRAYGWIAEESGQLSH
jgi:hypothetical protein